MTKKDQKKKAAFPAGQWRPPALPPGAGLPGKDGRSTCAARALKPQPIHALCRPYRRMERNSGVVGPCRADLLLLRPRPQLLCARTVSPRHGQMLLARMASRPPRPRSRLTRRSGADGRGRLLHECIYSEEFACRGTRTRCRLVLCFHTASVSRVAFLTLRHVLFITMHLCTSKQIKWNKEIKQHFFSIPVYFYLLFFSSLALLRIRRLSIKVRDGCTDLYLYMTG